jgi:hypothetical protein
MDFFAFLFGFVGEHSERNCAPLESASGGLKKAKKIARGITLWLLAVWARLKLRPILGTTPTQTEGVASTIVHPLPSTVVAQDRS